MPTRTFRPRTLAWLCPVGAVGMAVLMGLGVVNVVFGSNYDGRPADRVGVVLFLALFGTGTVVMLAAMGRCRVDVGPERVVIQNPFRRYDLPREEVLGLTATRGGDWAYLRLRSERRVVVMALSVGARWTLRRRLNELNDSLGWVSAP